MKHIDEVICRGSDGDYKDNVYKHSDSENDNDIHFYCNSNTKHNTFDIKDYTKIEHMNGILFKEDITVYLKFNSKSTLNNGDSLDEYNNDSVDGDNNITLTGKSSLYQMNQDSSYICSVSNFYITQTCKTDDSLTRCISDDGRHLTIIYIYYRFIIHSPIGLDFLFITFLLHFLLSWTSSLSISSSAISTSTLSNHVFLGLPTGLLPSTL